MKVDQVLACFDYLDIEKVKIVTYEFIGYTLLCREIREGRRRHANMWDDLRREIKSRFVLASYIEDLYNKLQRMYQGFKNIEEYYKDMEVALFRANVLKSNDTIMAHFLHKLNKDL
ncbi:hypothetical protein CR513_09549, partial [Mucuna pruriens]